MPIEIRATKPDELRPVANTVAAALLFPHLTDAEWTERESSWNDAFSLSAWDGDTCVGHAGAFRFETTAPGGRRLKTFGVTRIGVLPTYTRQGLLTTMMNQMLSEARDDGVVLASLRASEAVIYGRYGYGIAGESTSIRIRTRSAGPVLNPAPGSMRILRRGEVVDVIPPLYDRCMASRVGTVTRPDFLFRRYFADAISGEKPSFVAVHVAPDGTLDGYVHYAVEWQKNGFGEADTGAGEIIELWGADPAVERALWAYVLDIDLIHEWKSDNRPVDDAIRFAIRDTRAYTTKERWDEQWVRILDVDAALSARSYQPCDRSVVIAVDDPLFAGNTGSWRISAIGAVRTDDEPDVSAAIDAISAAYLGGTSWRELSDSGRITATSATAIADADLLFLQRPLPFCGSFF